MASADFSTTDPTTTAIPTKGQNSNDMVQVWIWLLVAVAIIGFLFKFCTWCAEQNRESGSTPTRSLSTVAIIDAAAPQSMTCPRCDPSEYFAGLDQPPPYGSLLQGYHEDPPPSYSSLMLHALPTEEHRQPTASTENHTGDSSHSLHM